MSDKEHNSLIIKKCLDEDCEKSNVFEYYYADRYCTKNSKKIEHGEWKSLPSWQQDADGNFEKTAGTGEFVKDKKLFENVKRLYWSEGSYIDSKGNKFDYIFNYDKNNNIIKKLNDYFQWNEYNTNNYSAKLKPLKTYDYCILKTPYVDNDKVIQDNNENFRKFYEKKYNLNEVINNVEVDREEVTIEGDGIVYTKDEYDKVNCTPPPPLAAPLAAPTPPPLADPEKSLCESLEVFNEIKFTYETKPLIFNIEDRQIEGTNVRVTKLSLKEPLDPFFETTNETIVFDNYNGLPEAVKKSKVTVNFLLHFQKKNPTERLWGKEVVPTNRYDNCIIPREWLRKDISEKPQRVDFNYFTGTNIGCKKPSDGEDILHGCDNDQGRFNASEKHKPFIYNTLNDNQRINNYFTQQDLDKFVNELMDNKTNLGTNFKNKNKVKLLELYESVRNPNSKQKIKEFLEGIPLNKVSTMKNLATDEANLHHKTEQDRTDNINGFLIPDKVKLDIYCIDHDPNLKCKPGQNLNLNYNSVKDCYKHVCIESFSPKVVKKKSKKSKAWIYVLIVLSVMIFIAIGFFIFTRYYKPLQK